MSPSESPASSARSYSALLWTVILLVAGGVGLWLATRPNPVALCDQGLIAMKQNPQEAERLLRQAISAAGGNFPDAQIALSRLLLARGALAEAQQFFAAADKQKCRSDLLLDFGRTAYQAGRLPEAVEALEIVRENRSKESIAALELLLPVYRQLGKQEESIGVIRELTELQPDQPRHHWELIQALKAAHMESECLAAIRTALRHDPPRDLWIELQYLLIEQLIVQGDAESAWREIALMEKLEAGNSRLQAKKIDLYRMEGRLEKALEAITQLFPQVEQMPVAYLTRGVIYLDLGRYPEAVRDLEKAVQAQPMNEGAQFKLSEAYRGLGKDEESRRHRELGVNIRKKRVRLNELLKQQATADQKAKDELAQLFRELGEAGPGSSPSSP